MMTTAQAAMQWGINLNTVAWYIRKGRIEGAKKNANGKWMIPIGTSKPAPHKNGRKKQPIACPEEPEKPQPIQWRMEPEEAVEYIKKNCITKSYRELRRVTGLPLKEIRRIYDHLHEAYGI